MARENTTVSYQQRILRVLTYIKNHLDEPLDLPQLADIAYFSPHHFHRIFSELVGETVKEHVRRLKLERAMVQLAMDKDSITDIAFQAGFNSLEAFSRVIKTQYQLTPTQVRKNTQQQIKTSVSNDSDLEVRKVQLDGFDLAYARHIGDYSHAGRAWVKLIELTDIKYILEEDRIRLGFAYDHPVITPANKCCYDACIPWQDEFVESGLLGRFQVKPGDFLMFVHHGSLDTIDQTYRLFIRQCIASDTSDFCDRHNFMWYKNTAMLSDPALQVTECYFPVD